MSAANRIRERRDAVRSAARSCNAMRTFEAVAAGELTARAAADLTMTLPSPRQQLRRRQPVPLSAWRRLGAWLAAWARHVRPDWRLL